MDDKGYLSYTSANVFKKSDKLIRRMIKSKFTCNIKIKNNTENYTSFANYNNASTTGSNATVFINPNFHPKIETIHPKTGIVEFYGGRPMYIGLAHELIHADRSMRGKLIPLKQEATYSFLIRYIRKIGKKKVWTSSYLRAKAPKEELATVGLMFVKQGDITENMIRKEHGLWLRGKY